MTNFLLGVAVGLAIAIIAVLIWLIRAMKKFNHF
jgi:hypothetical protein